MDTDTDEKTAMELTRNPMDGTWGFICREHAIHRYGLSEHHARNVEAKHIREDHPDPLAVELNVGDLAATVVRWAETPTAGSVADATTRRVLLSAWRDLVGGTEGESLHLAQRLADTPGGVRAVVVPF